MTGKSKGTRKSLPAKQGPGRKSKACEQPGQRRQPYLDRPCVRGPVIKQEKVKGQSGCPFIAPPPVSQNEGTVRVLVFRTCFLHRARRQGGEGDRSVFPSTRSSFEREIGDSIRFFYNRRPVERTRSVRAIRSIGDRRQIFGANGNKENPPATAGGRPVEARHVKKKEEVRRDKSEESTRGRGQEGVQRKNTKSLTAETAPSGKVHVSPRPVVRKERSAGARDQAGRPSKAEGRRARQVR
ncbi:hypothetical protein R1flu_022452 [Riccia fluitans]|uniref:Uncharacterized protein n=1 Tax=Riccia fluitans TaxID=41844 RepID=A0ABD1XP76_9MARC